MFDLDHVLVAADALVDVRRHVDDVAGAGHERQQAIGLGFGALRRVGRLPQVDPEMERAGMVLVAREHPLELAGHLLGFLVGQAVARPVVPRPQVHQRFREQRPRVVVLRELRHQLAHGVGIRAIGGGAVFGFPV